MLKLTKKLSEKWKNTKSRKEKGFFTFDSINDGGNGCLGLPRDIWLLIFSYLDAKELKNVSSVCRLWWKHSNDEIIWKNLCLSIGFEEEEFSTDKTWKQNYLQFASRILAGWKWNKNDKDPVIEVNSSCTQVKRNPGGHNPSIRGDKACTNKNRQYYFEIEIIRVGEWLSFGFASKVFGVSSRCHIGKGSGSCAYYSDSSTHSIFAPEIPCTSVRQLHDGDRVGCLIDMKDNSATFFTNDIKQARITYPGLSKSPLYPALSLGLGAIVQISEPHRVPIIK